MIGSIGDVNLWAKDLRKTWIGDSNVDGEFNSADFVNVFQKGKYETDKGAVWSEGDWDGDGAFNSGDFVSAFQDGGYEAGPRTAFNAVPEPSSLLLLVCGLLPVLHRQRKTSCNPW